MNPTVIEAAMNAFAKATDAGKPARERMALTIYAADLARFEQWRNPAADPTLEAVGHAIEQAQVAYQELEGETWHETDWATFTAAAAIAALDAARAEAVTAALRELAPDIRAAVEWLEVVVQDWKDADEAGIGVEIIGASNAVRAARRELLSLLGIEEQTP